MLETKMKLDEFVNNFRKLETDYFSGNLISTDTLINCLEFIRTQTRKTNLDQVSEWCEVLGFLVTVINRWVNSNAEINNEQIEKLVLLRPAIFCIYARSYDSKQKFLTASYNHGTKYKFIKTKQIILVSINNLNDQLFANYEKAPDDIKFLMAITWLRERIQITPASKKYHQLIVNSFDRFQNITIKDNWITPICSAYMFTTYSNSLNKDKIKGTVHDLIGKHYDVKYGLENIETKRKTLRAKPKILIVHERFFVGHVMIRIFHSIFVNLSKEFDVVHVAFEEKEKELPNNLGKIIRSEIGLGAILNSIKAEDPDVIYYPSLGMSVFTITLASFRLAPIQLQGMGHPSSSHSKVIDGSIHLNPDFKHSGFEKHYSYKGYQEGIYIPLTLKSLSRDISNVPASKHTGIWNIGINGKMMKMSPNFMEFLKNIEWPNNVSLHFFPAETGLNFFAAENSIKGYFPKATVYRVVEYEDFISQMSILDFCICPFPFGNTNGVLDCIYLGLPQFALRGSETCSSSETDFLEHIGAVDCIFDSQEDFKLAIEKFFDDENYRNRLVSGFKKKCEAFKKQNDLEKAQRYEAENFVNWIRESIQNYEQV